MSKTISSQTTSRYTLSSASNPLTITSSGAVDVSTGIAILGSSAQAWTVDNAGTVAGGNGAGGIGISFGDGGTIDNTGTITAFTAGITISGAAGTITNAGTIIGSVDAVAFGGSYADRLIEDAGAVLTGKVLGGSGSNALELAPGTTSAGTITNFATQFTGFGTIVVDQGGHWTLGMLAATTLTDSGVLTTTGSAAVPGTLTVIGGLRALFTNLDAGGTLVNIGTLGLSGSSEVQGGHAANASGGFNGLGGVLLNSASLTNAGTLRLDGAAAGGFDLYGGTGATLINTGILLNTALLSLTGGGSGCYFGSSGGGALLIDSGKLTNTGTLSLAGGPKWPGSRTARRATAPACWWPAAWPIQARSWWGPA